MIRPFDYDPMVYDVMCELGNQLAGHCVNRSYGATSDEERERWRIRALEVHREVDAMDPYDEVAIRAKTQDFSDRLRSLSPFMAED